MKSKINYSKYIKEKNLISLFENLYPICRSITGKGFTDSLKILDKITKLKIKKVKSGTKVLDWTVPYVWNIEDAYLLENKKKIIDFKKHNLHVLNYSHPINQNVSFDELKKHIYTLPKMPNAIPYVHSYYKRNWGFAMKHKNLKQL